MSCFAGQSDEFEEKRTCQKHLPFCGKIDNIYSISFMRTKKQVVVVFLLLSLMIDVKAFDITPAGKRFRSDIMTFLSQEGFSPSIDDDESLCFKKEGEQYWIDIHDDGPYYVEFHRANLGSETADQDAVLKAVNKVNSEKRVVKCCALGSKIAITIESYCYKSEDFKYVFYKCLDILEDSYDELQTNYQKFLEEGSTVAEKSSVGNWPAHPKIGRVTFGVTTFQDLIDAGVPFEKKSESKVYEGYKYRNKDYAEVSNNELVTYVTSFKALGADVPDFLAATGINWEYSLSQLKNVISRYGWKIRITADDNSYITFSHNSTYYVHAGFSNGKLNYIIVKPL